MAYLIQFCCSVALHSDIISVKILLFAFSLEAQQLSAQERKEAC